MSRLKVTLIDVGWGDSILIESEAAGQVHYALIDSNDTQTLRSSYIFLKRLFEKKEIDLDTAKPVFEFVLLSHAHSDHAQGLKSLMRAFGTNYFWYPKSLRWASCADLIRYANRSSNVKQHQAVDNTNILPSLGDATVRLLWPERDSIDANENNNSVVLQLEAGGVSFVLTGDAEEEVWGRIAGRIPANTKFFKVPHHGSDNGSLDANGDPVWLHHCPDQALLGISSHVRPFHHPAEKVVRLFQDNNRALYRTDQHYHLTFETQGQDVEVRFWR